MQRLPQKPNPPSSPSPIAVGEIVEIRNTSFTAQCLEPESLSFPHLPAFGSFVKAEDEETHNVILAVVYQSGTSTCDSVHHVRALGMTIDEIKEQQPQIFGLLSTAFTVVIVGFFLPDGRSYRQYLPPRPPQIHQTVFRASDEEVCWFANQLDFISTLLNVAEAPTDALVAATLRNIYQARNLDRSWLVKSGRRLNLLLRDDYDRLRLILAQLA